MRFTADQPLPGSFSGGAANCDVNVRDISVNGAQIEHTYALRPGMRGRFAIGRFNSPSVVVWTRMTVAGRYRSGLRLEAGLDLVASAIRELLAHGAIRKADDTQRQHDDARLERVRTQQLAKNPPQDTLSAHAIRSARTWMLAHPEEAARWHQRARLAATAPQLQVAGAGRLNRDDVLAVWEYLERRVGIADIVQTLDEPDRAA